MILITKKPAHHIDERANYLLFLTEALTKIGEPTAESYFTSLRGDRGKPLRCLKLRGYSKHRWCRYHQLR